MRSHRARRWLAGSAVTFLATLAVASGPAGAASGTEDLQVFVPTTTLAPGGVSKLIDATIFFPDQVIIAHTMTFDLATVADLATFTPVPTGRYDCTTAATTITCASLALPTDTSGMAVIAVDARIKNGVTPGASGTVKVTVAASGGARASAEAVVRIGTGVDLTVHPMLVETGARPGDAVERPLSVQNAGSTSVEGVVLLLGFTP